MAYLFRYAYRVQRLSLEIPDREWLGHVLYRLGSWTSGTELRFPPLKGLRELRIATDGQWIGLVNEVETMLTRREELEGHLVQVFCDDYVPEESEEWVLAKEELNRFLHRFADRRRRITEEERGH